MTGLAPFVGFDQYAIPQRGNMAQPAAESPMSALQTGRTVARNPGRFNRQSTRTAQRIEQRPACRRNRQPACFQ